MAHVVRIGCGTATATGPSCPRGLCATNTGAAHLLLQERVKRWGWNEGSLEDAVWREAEEGDALGGKNLAAAPPGANLSLVNKVPSHQEWVPQALSWEQEHPSPAPSAAM